MDRTGENYAKLNKSGGEGQICDLTIKWNLINQPKKTKQNITRDIKIKSNLTVPKGRWGWIIVVDNGGRGFQE